MRLFRESKTFILRVNKLGTTNYLSGVPFSTNLEEEKNEGTEYKYNINIIYTILNA